MEEPAGGSECPETRVRNSQPTFQRRDMRHLLPVKSRGWWIVVLCALATVAIFMAFEVLDLDGSDLYKRLFQSPIPSEPTVAWAEEIMRHGVVAIPETLGHMQALDSLRLPSTDVSRCLDATSAPLGRRLMTIRPRASLHRASFHPPASSDEPSGPTRRAI